MEIVLVRHGESTSNVVGRWQGQGDAPLSEDGRAQARSVAARLAPEPFDLVVSSDLSRAADTARATGREVELDPAWREIDVGAWEGLTRREVAERFGDQLRGLAAGEPIAIGGGESWPALHARVDAAFRRLVGRLDPGGRALVFAHGGVIGSLVWGLLGLRERQRRPVGRVTNTGIARLRVEDDRVTVSVWNDAAHLGGLTGWAAERHEHHGDAVVTLVSHDPRTDDATADDGAGRLRGGGALLGAERLASRYDALDWVYARSRGRGRDVAAVLSTRLSASLLEAEAPAPTLHEAVTRAALAHRGARVGLVADADEVAAYAAGVLGDADAPSPPLVVTPGHAAVTHVIVAGSGHTLADWNVRHSQ